MAELVIAPELLARIVAHAQREWPLEACGLLAVAGTRVVDAWAGTNELASPVRYRMAAEEVARLMWEIEEVRGQEAGSYHSHPRGPARLSPTDLAEAGCRYNLLVSLADRARPAVHLFRVEGGHVTEENLRTGPPPAGRSTI